MFDTFSFAYLKLSWKVLVTGFVEEEFSFDDETCKK